LGAYPPPWTKEIGLLNGRTRAVTAENVSAEYIHTDSYMFSIIAIEYVTVGTVLLLKAAASSHIYFYPFPPEFFSRRRRYNEMKNIYSL
jgi:hypothetical protein